MFIEHWDGSEEMDAEIGVKKEKKKLKVPKIKSRGGICRFRTDPLIGARLDPYLRSTYGVDSILGYYTK